MVDQARSFYFKKMRGLLTVADAVGAYSTRHISNKEIRKVAWLPPVA
jgi:hypothetical protein